MDNVKIKFLENLNHFQIRDALYHAFKDSIITNSFDSSLRFKDVEIASFLQISRTPVREVLLLLEQNDFISSDPVRGSVVKSYTIQQLIDLINYIRILRRSIVGIVAKRITESELSLMNRYTHHNFSNYKKHQAFYLEIAKITCNIYFINSTLKTNEKSLMIYNRYSEDMKNEFAVTSYLERYIGLLDAFTNHDSNKAEKIIDTYSNDLTHVIQRLYSSSFHKSIHSFSPNTSLLY